MARQHADKGSTGDVQRVGDLLQPGGAMVAGQHPGNGVAYPCQLVGFADGRFHRRNLALRHRPEQRVIIGILDRLPPAGKTQPFGLVRLHFPTGKACQHGLGSRVAAYSCFEHHLGGIREGQRLDRAVDQRERSECGKLEQRSHRPGWSQADADMVFAFLEGDQHERVLAGDGLDHGAQRLTEIGGMQQR